VVAISVDSQFTHLGTMSNSKFLKICFFHLAWINTPREQGGLGNIQIPLLSDLTHQISKDYGVYLQDVGHALRYE
jgi:alkyl hydroperoxide reductase subunit AhpC